MSCEFNAHSMFSTGKAIKMMADEGFSDSHGARSGLENVARVAIVITDGATLFKTSSLTLYLGGRNNDDMSIPLSYGRDKGINMFALGIGNTNDGQLNEIAGSLDRKFVIEDFKDLDKYLLGRIQNQTCGGQVPTGK
jgi:hypothetical protein